MKCLHIFTCMAAGLILALSPATAATVTYSSLAGFTSASTGLTTIDFQSDTAAGGFSGYSTSAGLVQNGVDFIGYLTSSSYDLSVFDSTYASWSNYGTGAVLFGPHYNSNPLPYLRIALPSNVTAVGLNLGTSSPHGTNLQITLSDGEAFSNIATPTTQTLNFWGVTTDNPISYITLSLSGASTGQSTYAVIDNFAFGAATPSGGTDGTPGQTPEAATLVLIGTGLLFFSWKRRRAIGVLSGA